VLRIQDPVLFWPLDPGPRSEIRDGKKPDPGIPDHFTESWETVLALKLLKFFYADPDPGSGIFFYPVQVSGIRDGKLRIRDP